MNETFTYYLYNKHILVSDGINATENNFQALYMLRTAFNVKITEGSALANKSVMDFLYGTRHICVPEPFYRGFPESVIKLDSFQKLLDQILHYQKTYGEGDFSEGNSHSIFEEAIKRSDFVEEIAPESFAIVTEDAGMKIIEEDISDALKSTRPLSAEMSILVLRYISEYGRNDRWHIASKNTAAEILYYTRDLYYSKFIDFDGILRLVEIMERKNGRSGKLNKLNLKNTDRKFIADLIDEKLSSMDTLTYFDKKKIWAGLLHHIHYVPRTKNGKLFVMYVRSNGVNLSSYALFEDKMARKDIVGATSYLLAEKGPAAAIRHLNYILSRCNSMQEKKKVLDMIFFRFFKSCGNGLILFQLLNAYEDYDFTGDARMFTFEKFSLLKNWTETEEEKGKRRSLLDKETVDLVKEYLIKAIRHHYSGCISESVYVDPAMKNIALPMQMATSNGGFGTLPTGSILSIPEGKKIRAFTYWEKVNDIDLSVIGLREDWTREEYSWRTMRYNNDSSIVYSGDVTDGFNGGSEYFDVDIERFAKEHPDTTHLVFCNNVYSHLNFSQCLCTAGFMNRDILDSGEVYEPKTVKSSFKIDADSAFAYLFAIDLKKRIIIWLNIKADSRQHVAGNKDLNFLKKYFIITDTLNVYDFFKILARNTVDSKEDADLIVSDSSADPKYIHSYDFAKIMAYMNM